jgi:alpha-L-rhamnosidase
LARATKAAFWDEPRGLFADDLARTHFSEHTQCLALLSGTLEGEQLRLTGQNLLRDPGLTRTTIYFNHYLFETYRCLNSLARSSNAWGCGLTCRRRVLKRRQNMPEPTRSDCHGWGAHPLYHYFASLLGIRPAVFGFERVEIAPMPGHLSNLSASMVHPSGEIAADLEFADGRVHGSVTLPASISGTFRYAGKIVDLQPGTQPIDLSAA